MKKLQILSLAAGSGLLAGCSSWGSRDSAPASLTLNHLPPVAQSSIRDEIGHQHIYSIKQETKDGQTPYRVEGERHGFYPTRPSLIVSQDGAVLKESRRLASRPVNEAAGAETTDGSASTPSSSPDSPQAPSEANPAGTNPTRALPSVDSGPSGP